MDRLDEAIDAKIKEAEALRKRAEQALLKAEQVEQEVRILRRAAELRPMSQAAPIQQGRLVAEQAEAIKSELRDRISAKILDEAHSIIRRGGRQSGSISLKWRDVLSALASHGNKPFAAEALIVAAESYGLEIEDRSARERIRRYVDQGFITELGSNQFQVTDTAIERFKLLKENEGTPDGW